MSHGRQILLAGGVVSAIVAVLHAGPQPDRARPNVLIIGASSLNSPVAQTHLLGAMLESKGIHAHVEGQWPRLDAVDRMLGSKRTWDYVVMDAWHLGREPGAFGTAQVPAQFPNAVAAFVKQVRAHSPGCRIILFSWWVPAGPKATKEGVMEVFRSCAEQGGRHGIWVAATGPAFMEALLGRHDLHIVRSKTDAHPGIHGAYLNASSLFAVITDRTPVGLPATLRLADRKREEFSIAPGDAKYLQELAWTVYRREIKHVRQAEKSSEGR